MWNAPQANADSPSSTSTLRQSTRREISAPYWPARPGIDPMSSSSYWPMSAVYVHGTAPFSRIQATATDVSRPPEKATPTRSPTGREVSTFDTQASLGADAPSARAGRHVDSADVTISVRPATTDDWPSIWPIVDATVQAGETYAYPRDLTSESAYGLWMEEPPGLTVIAVDDNGGAVVGTAKMGPNRPAQGSHIGTASFMVAPGARGLGVGRALGDYVVRWHREQGYRGIQFNAVVETNVAAVNLWKQLGFEIIGTVPGAFDHPQQGYVGLHIMFRAINGRNGRPNAPTTP